MFEINFDKSASPATQTGSAKIQAQHEPIPPVDLVRFESGSNVYGITLGWNDEFTLSASDDRDSAILKTSGADLSSRLQQVLPLVASSTPLAGADFAEAIERLLRCDVSIRLEWAQSLPSTQLELAADKWMAQVRAWASSHPQSDRIIDDSRDSIYGYRA